MSDTVPPQGLAIDSRWPRGIGGGLRSVKLQNVASLQKDSLGRDLDLSGEWQEREHRGLDAEKLSTTD